MFANTAALRQRARQRDGMCLVVADLTAADSSIMLQCNTQHATCWVASARQATLGCIMPDATCRSSMLNADCSTSRRAQQMSHTSGISHATQSDHRNDRTIVLPPRMAWHGMAWHAHASSERRMPTRTHYSLNRSRTGTSASFRRACALPHAHERPGRSAGC